MMFFPGDGSVEFFVNFPVAGVNAAITDHFIMLFRDMADEPFYEIHNRDGFFHISVISVAVVVEGNKVAIISIDPGGGNNRTAKIASNVFHNRFWVTFVRFCIYIKPFSVFPIAEGSYFFKGRADLDFQFIQKGGTERIAKVGIVEVVDPAPKASIAVSTLRDEAMDMGVPF